MPIRIATGAATTSLEGSTMTPPAHAHQAASAVVSENRQKRGTQDAITIMRIVKLYDETLIILEMGEAGPNGVAPIAQTAAIGAEAYVKPELKRTKFRPRTWFRGVYGIVVDAGDLICPLDESGFRVIPADQWQMPLYRKSDRTYFARVLLVRGRKVWVELPREGSAEAADGPFDPVEYDRAYIEANFVTKRVISACDDEHDTPSNTGPSAPALDGQAPTDDGQQYFAG